ncbi:MAG: class I SAM-dependent methyltransferase [Chloroflexi bacterium]|nr:class I SAM-dependent methyltransferase [Chloroflexota bacterium]MCI0579357.1 class I SAM-dependent methyltransferase [Chloroflexota bacterium]MCI0646010.1 class I SAM-dependent methyltransferase [Chloroflexota bacterium]MCI0727432.1 class I SAM-dependent methyltransferase [Chloroflexota bacterium]
MDELSKYNQSRWEALAHARVEYSRPLLQLTTAGALAALDPDPVFVDSRFSDVAGQDVLCLASGGGQQSAAFALLGARVTVLDFSETQLARDSEAAAHYGHAVCTVQGDMRDLSVFADDSFDVVWQPYSINFVPDASRVIGEVGRVIRPGGFYHLQFANPFWSMKEMDWVPQGYPVRQPYVTGRQLLFADDDWTFSDEAGVEHRLEGPHEFLHTFGAIVNALTGHGFVILGLREGPPGDPTAEPGTWDHMLSVIPPFMAVGATYRPDVLFPQRIS